MLAFGCVYLYFYNHAHCCSKNPIKRTPFLVKFAYFSPKV
ncbi:hypothetical protein HMPREF1991_00808 [Hoylesella loescheii DSM 19665 = JCM 12249 = ATCC 15930]|uniref:Uncharacterized protein n=1 Tax=Hoylesella loescheii DSM 19665 = JCM 12249 = ATCC 15930 TaxID=1122985 RepID=A0A069QK83_HOYLO|nr:hypothetical protein HMPREF1991_00808 [Hoylesella loescheii DSM 19665 = JCM 12249 = ATCC 15930]